MKKRLVITLVLVGLLAFGVGMGTFAWFTSSATSTNNTFATGTLTIGLDDADDEADIAAKFEETNWQPGSSATATVDVENRGTLDLKYKLEVVANEGNGTLYDELQVVVKSGTTELYNGALSGMESAPTNLLDRELVAETGSETLDIEVFLPTSVTDQSLTAADFNFVFKARQTSDSATYSE